MKLVYLGTPGMAVPPLKALTEAGHDVALVVTGADKRRGRGGKLSPSPVKAAAHDLQIPVSHDVDDVMGVGADLGVVVAFGQLIKPHVLDVLPMVNLHFSLLPRWRGAAPVERAMLAGDVVTGVGVMALEEGLDTGGIYAELEVPISSTTTADELRSELVEVGTRLLVDTLDSGLGVQRPQQGPAVYAAKIKPEELQIDWDQPVEYIARLVRLGGAWTTFRGARLKIHEACIADGKLLPMVVQPQGKARMDYKSWLNGARPADGEDFE